MSTQSTETKELFSALSRAQASLKSAIKDSKNPFFNSSYADLESCWGASRDVLTQNGLSVSQTMDHESGVDFLVTILAHSSGQWIKGKLRLNPVKNDPQSMGSAITYTRRYAFAAIIGLTQTDDDGETASGRGKKSGGIPMDMPTNDDGNTEPTGYRIPFGKFKQRSLEEIGPSELRSYVEYLEKKAKKDNKEITGVVADFIDRAFEYVCSFENQRGDAFE